MSKLTDREKELVAIGASIGSNCVPCIAFHVRQAKEAGLSDDQVEQAIALADKIRAVPAKLVINTARAHLDGDEQEASTGDDEPPAACRC